MFDFPAVILHDEQHVWASYIPLRSPVFKVHKTKGAATNALALRGYNEEYALYHLVNNYWTREFEYHPPTECRCGNTYTKNNWGRTEYFKDPLERVMWNAVPVCYNCYCSARTISYR